MGASKRTTLRVGRFALDTLLLQLMGFEVKLRMVGERTILPTFDTLSFENITEEETEEWSIGCLFFVYHHVVKRVLRKR